jgi:hypothetical protein
MERLFIVASDTLRTDDYLGCYCERPVIFSDSELISLEEEPWTRLESKILPLVAKRPDVIRLRVAGHLKCFLDNDGGPVQKALPEFAESLAKRLGQMTPFDTKIWGFKHVPESKIWSTLCGVTDLLGRPPHESTSRDFALQLWDAFREPGKAQLDDVGAAKHLFMRCGTVAVNLENAARAIEGNDQVRAQERFDKARQQLLEYVSDARTALVSLTRLAQACSDPERRATTEGVISELSERLNSIPAMEGSRRDGENFRDWAMRTTVVLNRLPKDLSK